MEGLINLISTNIWILDPRTFTVHGVFVTLRNRSFESYTQPKVASQKKNIFATKSSRLVLEVSLISINVSAYT